MHNGAAARVVPKEGEHGTAEAGAIQTFYAAAVQLAKLRGVDADRPRHLQKVTRTR